MSRSLAAVLGLVTCAAVATSGAACGPSAHDVGDDDHGAVDASGGPDSPGGPGVDAPDDTGGDAAVFAHTASTLFRVHPLTYEVTRVGDFQWPAGGDEMTDLAIDADGNMIGISFTRVYRVDPQTAACTLLSSNLQGLFNGLSFVPSMLAFGIEGPDVLVGTRNADGKVFQIDPNTGGVTQIGDMGGGFVSSGDIVAVTGFGVVATVTNGVGPDRLVRLAPTTFAATPIGSGTGFDHLWGVGFWGTRVFGFSERGVLTVIDSQTGVGTTVAPNSEAWWGAAVTTSAPIID
ncbi:MAG TPA: hypothetical protein VHE35_24885 [Kofleriaceae bacterium]|nr:hypothetical protein [Kofleriaceae bacterium]